MHGNRSQGPWEDHDQTESGSRRSRRQDERILDGLRLMNAFAAANPKSIDDLLAGRVAAATGPVASSGANARDVVG
jgi:hypothetical protein